MAISCFVSFWVQPKRSINQVGNVNVNPECTGQVRELERLTQAPRVGVRVGLVGSGQELPP